MSRELSDITATALDMNACQRLICNQGDYRQLLKQQASLHSQQDSTYI